MAHTHEYDCIVCGAHLDSSEQLSRHNKDLHLKTATGMERPRQRGDEAEEQDRREDRLPDREL